MGAEVDPVALLVIILALVAGGFVKGATGSGAPLVAVPIVAAFYDVTMGILMMVIPNVVMNLKQVWTYRAEIRPVGTILMLFVGSVPGMFLGTRLLTTAPQDLLQLGLGVFLAVFLALRVIDPRFSLSPRAAFRLSLPVGVVGGVMQGAIGASGPLVMLFLSSQNLARPAFIGMASAAYLANSTIQIPALLSEGLLTPHWIWISTLAVIPVWISLPLGDRAARHLSREAFNGWVIVLLAALAARLIWRALT